MANTPDTQNGDKKRILLIEDDPIISDLMREKLQEKFITLKATTCAQARSILHRQKVDLILLDIILPDMDGFKFLEEIKSDEQLKNIPVIILSNLGQENEIAHGIKLGADDYLVKADYTPSEIIKHIDMVLEKEKEHLE